MNKKSGIEFSFNSPELISLLKKNSPGKPELLCFKDSKGNEVYRIENQ